MKRPLLKILPGVAVVLLSASCSKDDDNNIAEDNTALVAEQKIEHKVFYLKIRNASSLAKMTVEGLGETGAKKALKFVNGDILNLTFYVNVSYPFYSGDDYVFDETECVEVEAEAVYKNGVFETTITKVFNYSSDNSSAWNAANNALEAMQNEVEDAALTYNVQLTWGNKDLLTNEKGDFKTKGFVECESQTAMFDDAPRSAVKCFTLSQDGDYCFIVFEDGCTKEVKIGEETLNNGKCYIVAPNTTVTVAGSDKITESGKLYYVRK